jgi:hypothetical protein
VRNAFVRISTAVLKAMGSAAGVATTVIRVRLPPLTAKIRVLVCAAMLDRATTVRFALAELAAREKFGARKCSAPQMPNARKVLATGHVWIAIAAATKLPTAPLASFATCSTTFAGKFPKPAFQMPNVFQSALCVMQ